MKQDQFLNVIDRDEAERRFRAALDLHPLPGEDVDLTYALGRVLARDVVAPVDVPSFDRANVDGFAVRVEDTFGAGEEQPRPLTLTGEILAPGMVPQKTINLGQASPIATGAMIPRGADAVVMVEYTNVKDNVVSISRPVTPGANISFAGTDIGLGETVLRHGDVLTSRETGVLAALGLERVNVVRKPRVAILSTGNELIAPGQTMRPGLVFDSNATILADAVRELGGEPIYFGIVPDERQALTSKLQEALSCDVVLLSGGTSKGEGDISYRVVADLGPPGIIAHGVALKPGKPLCLAVVKRGVRSEEIGVRSQETNSFPGHASSGSLGGFASSPLSPHSSLLTPHSCIPVVILPGFPTSAIFTFQEFVAPVIRLLAGHRELTRETVAARLPMRVNSERGRTEYLLVGLVEDSRGLVAYPMGKGSGSVTTFSRADGFVIIPRQQEYLEANTPVEVHLLGKGLRPADLVVIGSHCVGLDFLLGKLQERGFSTKFLAAGSTGGLEAARRGECDLAGIHLLDPATGVYNRPFLTPELELIPGYQRLQGLVYRPDDLRFQNKSLSQFLEAALSDPSCAMVNRNRGSGTRILIDQLLAGAHPSGYSVEAKSHNAVAAAVAQGRADWGVAIATVAQATGLGFLALQEEHYDFIVPKSRMERPAVMAFVQILEKQEIRVSLEAMGFKLASGAA